MGRTKLCKSRSISHRLDRYQTFAQNGFTSSYLSLAHFTQFVTCLYEYPHYLPINLETISTISCLGKMYSDHGST